MSDQVELSDLSREQLEEIIRCTQRRQSLSGQKDVVKATAAVVRKKEEKLQAEISEASQRAVVMKSVDACFVLDCTGSMTSQIQAAKEKIVEIQSGIVGCLGNGGTVHFSVVGYRDYGSMNSQFEVLPFTEDVNDVQSFLSKLKPSGGYCHAGMDADVCENMIGALSQSFQLKWQSRTRIIYIVADAPPHGRRFAKPQYQFNTRNLRKIFDSYPNDVQQWEETDRLMAQSLALSLNFVLLEYPWGEWRLLEKTFQVFSELRNTSASARLQTLLLRPDNTADDFVNCILATSKETLSKTLTQPMSDKSGATSGSSGATLSLDAKAAISWQDWRSWPVQRVLVTNVNVFALTSDTNPRAIQSFHIRGEPFASGSMRYAFPATDGTVRFVFKVHKDSSHSTSSMTLADVQTQAYAKVFAQEFSQRFRVAPVQFLDVWAVELPKWNIAKHATLEPFVDGDFQKYTSNNGFISQEAELAEAFCHFSWCHSAGQLMVTDLQGFGSAVFTDPQIHCVKKDFFSRGNLGKSGMDQFFVGHCCNEICRSLQLKESPIQFAWETASMVSDCSGELSTRFASHGPLTCEYCNGFVTVRDQEYIDLIEEYQAVVCPSCKAKVKESIATTRCMTCNQPFKYSMYTISVKGSSVPPVCRSCEQGEVWRYVD